MRIPHNYLSLLFGLFFGLILTACDDFAKSPYTDITFEKLAPLPSGGRSSAVGFSIDGKGYVALGKTAQKSGFLNDCWEYNPTLNTWAQKASFPGVPRVRATAQVVGSKAYVGLGFAEVAIYQKTGFLNDFWMYDSNTDIWSKKADFPSISTNACVSFVFKNKIYVGAGYSEKGFKNDFWRYDPADNTWTQLNNFPAGARSGAVICTNGERVFFGTGFDAFNMADWWEYFPDNDSWSGLKKMPDKGREDAVALSIDNRYFVATGKYFQGTLTGGDVKSDIYEYDAIRNVWYKRGEIPNGKRENAIAFTINGKGYIGFGETFTSILNDFWSFKP